MVMVAIMVIIVVVIMMLVAAIFMIMMLVVAIFVIMLVVAVIVTFTLDIPTFVMFVPSILPRAIAGFVFRGSHKIYGPIARMIFVTVLTPVLRVSRRHMQVDRLDAHSSRRLLDDNRLRVDQLRRGSVGQIHSAVDTGRDLPRYRQADIQVAGSRQGGRQAERSGKQRHGTNYLGHHNSSSVSAPRRHQRLCIAGLKAGRPGMANRERDRISHWAELTAAAKDYFEVSSSGYAPESTGSMIVGESSISSAGISIVSTMA